MSEATPASKLAHAGSSTNACFTPASVFDWLFSSPFATESSFTPAQNRIPNVEDERPVFIDEATVGLQNLHQLDPDNVHALPPTPRRAAPQVAPIVLVQLPNCLPFATIVLGALAAGLTTTLVSPSLTDKELAWVLQSSRPHIIVTATGCVPAMQHALDQQQDQSFARSVPVYTVNVGQDPYPALPPQPSPQDWTRLLAKSQAAIKQPRQFDAAARAAIILWSSGTSGRSKGVMLSHHALTFSTASIWHDADFYRAQRERWLGFVPFFHVYGLLNLFLVAIPTGSTVYTMASFNPDQMLAAIPKRQITYLHMAPPIAVFLAKSPMVEPYAKRDAEGRNKFSSLVAGVTGGAPLGHDVVAQVHARLGFRIRLGYGLTEAGGVTVQPGLSHVDKGDDTGRPHWGVELKIARPEESEQVMPMDEPGEILIRSPGLMMGYLPLNAFAGGHKFDTSATTAAITHDGWFRTGDIGSLDATGTLRISDRIKELIKVRAFQVPPAELEAILCSSDEVADAGVVATYDASEATEWPRAFVVAASQGIVSEDGLTALAHRLRLLVERQTSKYKWLRGGLVFVDKIPKSPSGKILRRVMKDGGIKGVEVSLYEKKTRSSKL
ncbi:4-coumarate--CoA ligase-like protein [Emericellopsis cladophorae]|uniref:4-coumarate--CoA ligase-like protein n=1 Tax=Emericellopsis cladophorae TaxID=2686198 RepID=A0A9P9Y9H4_9HYPO|nr:4-coumarate--CoA ligase-like protein [Emericellopsis cladophorae]KAI6785264.1 4-coumarate--CoA ligase-like protein [Emericellopsis cladophorae]